jgi:hypothetical protein
MSSRNSKFNEAFAKFNNTSSSTTGCDLARFSSASRHHHRTTPTHNTFHDGDHVMKSSGTKIRRMHHDEDSFTNASSSHDTLSSFSNNNDSNHSKDSRTRHQNTESFFMEYLEEEKEEEYVRGMNWTLEDRFNACGRPNEYIGGYSPEWICRYRRQKDGNSRGVKAQQYL